MNTLFFKYAIEVERTRSITQAAENLYMGQPNLSRAIREMEESLGFPIFERTSKGVVPTKKGAEFLVYAQNILVQLEKMDRLSKPDIGNAQVFSVSIPRASYISNGLVEFLKTLNPTQALDIDFQETNSMQSISNVSEGRHNIAIIRYRLTNENYFEDYLHNKQLDAETIWEFERVLLLSKDNPYLKDGIVSKADLKQCIEIVHGDTIVPYHQPGQKNQAKDVVKKFHLYERANQFEILSNMPNCYMWTSAIPENYLSRFDLCMAHSTEPGKQYKDVLIYQKGYKFSALDKRFIDKVYESKNHVAFSDF